jgi:protein-disulfide isomerase
MRIPTPLRAALAVLGLGLLTAAAPTDWTTVTRETPAGAFVLGNPAAPLKLVEYGSYTCPHCGAFSRESEAVLKGQMIKSGKVSLEYRHLIRDPMDLGAAILARCFGTRGFAGASAAVFATQDTWVPVLDSYVQAHPEVARLPTVPQARALADGSGLTAAMRARGLSPAQVNACFANKAEIDRITKMTGDAPIEVQGTPTFYLNNVQQPNVHWAELETTLRARGAK